MPGGPISPISPISPFSPGNPGSPLFIFNWKHYGVLDIFQYVSTFQQLTIPSCPGMPDSPLGPFKEKNTGSSNKRLTLQPQTDSVVNGEGLKVSSTVVALCKQKKLFDY